MNMAAKIAAEYLQGAGVKIDQFGDDMEVIQARYSADNVDRVEVRLFFDEDNRSVAVRSFNICKVAEARKPAIYETCSKLNDKFRWVKFYVDEDDNTVTAAMDAIIQLDSCGEESKELILRTVGIVDDAYPELMKALWA